MNKLEITTIIDKTFRDGSISKVIEIKPKRNNEVIQLDDVRKMYNILKKKHQNKKIHIQGMSGDRKRQLTVDGNRFVTDDDYDDYFDGKVEDDSKFKLFYQIKVNIYG